jgi:hypothetical protein
LIYFNPFIVSGEHSLVPSVFLGVVSVEEKLEIVVYFHGLADKEVSVQREIPAPANGPRRSYRTFSNAAAGS